MSDLPLQRIVPFLIHQSGSVLISFFLHQTSHGDGTLSILGISKQHKHILRYFGNVPLVCFRSGYRQSNALGLLQRRYRCGFARGNPFIALADSACYSVDCDVRYLPCQRHRSRVGVRAADVTMRAR